MRVFTVLPQANLQNVAAAAAALEQAGYEGAATMENRYEPFLALAVAATATAPKTIAVSWAEVTDAVAYEVEYRTPGSVTWTSPGAAIHTPV